MAIRSGHCAVFHTLYLPSTYPAGEIFKRTDIVADLFNFFCRDSLITVPIVLSIIALVLSVCVCIGLGVRLHQVSSQVQRQSGSSSYVQWGRSKCTGAAADTVYNGKFGSSHCSLDSRVTF